MEYIVPDDMPDLAKTSFSEVKKYSIMRTSWYQVMVFKQYWCCFKCSLINHLIVAQASFNTGLKKSFTYHIFS